MRRRGFTIIELLVVIGILALLMGLTLGGIAAMKKTDRLLVTEHLVGDVIRQARHTARTSGSPVTVKIDKAAREIVGISQVPIWNTGFESSPTLGNVLGMSGKGLQVTTIPFVSHSMPIQERLVRRAGQIDPFYLSCRVLPPRLTSDSGGGRIPLVLVGANANLAKSACGLMLRTESRVEQQLDSGFLQTAVAITDPRLATWEIIGWIADTTPPVDQQIVISSLRATDRPADIMRDEAQLHDSVNNIDPDPDKALDVAWPMAGGRWEEVGLLFDGERLVLYRNGVRVGQQVLGRVPKPPAAPDSLIVGRFIDTTTTPSTIDADMAVIDDVALRRLAASDPKRLPGDIAPDRDYSIVAHPDGRVEVNASPLITLVTSSAGTVASQAAALSQPTTLLFSGAFGAAGQAKLIVSIDGRVSGELILP